MDESPHRYRPLNTSQLHVLNSLYRFRFATSNLLSQTTTKTTQIVMNRKLNLLMRQGYIGRNFEPAYFASRRPASYFLAPDGVQALRATADPQYHPAVLKSVHKDATASQRFIAHSFKIFELYLRLTDIYGPNIKFFTKSQLRYYHYFPQPLPDAYVRLTNGAGERHYFIELVAGYEPFLAQVGRVKRFIKYDEDGDWEAATGTKLPQTLLLCDYWAQAKKLKSYADREVDDFDSDDSPIQIMTRDTITQQINQPF